MKTIHKEELFDNVRGFLKSRGIELTEGSYSNAVKASCSFLTDAINLGQQGMRRARNSMDKSLEQMRQVIHEKTAPPSQGTKPGAAKSAAAPPPKAAGTKKPSAAKRTAKQKPRGKR
jgi:hypothetical protein